MGYRNCSARHVQASYFKGVVAVYGLGIGYSLLIGVLRVPTIEPHLASDPFFFHVLILAEPVSASVNKIQID